MGDLYLDDKELEKEMSRCLQCPAKPCAKACPVLCSPYDFIKYAKEKDFTKAGEHILNHNPLGEVCGLVCPDKFCVKSCVRGRIDKAIKIPAIQAAIMKKFSERNKDYCPNYADGNGKKIAVIGFGPAGLGAVSELLKYGFEITVFEKESTFGGALNLIPAYRLPRDVMAGEWRRFLDNPLLKTRFNENCSDYEKLLQGGFSAVVIASGEQKRRCLGIDGEEFGIDYTDYLKNPENYSTAGSVAVIGGGATAVDCAVTAAKNGASHVEMFVRRGPENMRITEAEKLSLSEHEIAVSTFTRPAEIVKDEQFLTLKTIKTCFDENGKLRDVSEEKTPRKGWTYIIKALGSVRDGDLEKINGIYYAGDYVNGSSTAVEAISSGQKVAEEIVKDLSV